MNFETSSPASKRRSNSVAVIFSRPSRLVMELDLLINFFLFWVRSAHADDSAVIASLGDNRCPDRRPDSADHSETGLLRNRKRNFDPVGIEPKNLCFLEVDPSVRVCLGGSRFRGIELKWHRNNVASYLRV